MLFGRRVAREIAEEEVLHLSEDFDVIALLLVLRIVNSQPQCRPCSRASAWRARRPSSGATWTALTECNARRDPLPVPSHTKASVRCEVEQVCARRRVLEDNKRVEARKEAAACGDVLASASSRPLMPKE